MVNIILLFTVFSNTNSSTYTIIISSLCIVILLVDVFPRISKKHFVFNFVSITQGLLLISILFCSKILLDKYAPDHSATPFLSSIAPTSPCTPPVETT